MPIFEVYDIEQAYEDGANAVLEEIEKVFKRADIVSTTNPVPGERVLKAVKEVMNELKG